MWFCLSPLSPTDWWNTKYLLLLLKYSHAHHPEDSRRNHKIGCKLYSWRVKIGTFYFSSQSQKRIAQCERLSIFGFLCYWAQLLSHWMDPTFRSFTLLEPFHIISLSICDEIYQNATHCTLTFYGLQAQCSSLFKAWFCCNAISFTPLILSYMLRCQRAHVVSYRHSNTNP
jgi:hypothetical protein